MALAELARFADAASRQRRALELVPAAGVAAERMRRRLRLYEGGVPLRQPWRDGPETAAGGLPDPH
jgi:hypothetical protein